jgi:hypothetical protein
LRLGWLSYDESDLSGLTYLLECAEGAGILVEENLEDAYVEGRSYVVEVNNRAIVQAVALGKPVNFEGTYEAQENFQFDLPEYDPEWLKSGRFVVGKQVVEEQNWFLLTLEEATTGLDPLEAAGIRENGQTSLDVWLGIGGSGQEVGRVEEGAVRCQCGRV